MQNNYFISMVSYGTFKNGATFPIEDI